MREPLVLLTNNFTLPATTIAELYKQRWKVEVFFKSINQHLRIKRFFGNSGERCEVPDLDRRVLLPADRHRQEATSIGRIHAHAPTDLLAHAV